MLMTIKINIMTIIIAKILKNNNNKKIIYKKAIQEKDIHSSLNKNIKNIV